MGLLRVDHNETANHKEDVDADCAKPKPVKNVVGELIGQHCSERELSVKGDHKRRRDKAQKLNSIKQLCGPRSEYRWI
jgi:hypothetical protein